MANFLSEKCKIFSLALCNGKQLEIMSVKSYAAVKA
jgi:hypothetical protein